jgi:hypothetical protein
MPRKNHPHVGPIHKIKTNLTNLQTLGHGVEFFHDAIGIHHTLAFIEEYHWLDNPRAAVTVRLATSESLRSIHPQIDAEAIIAETIGALHKFLGNPDRRFFGHITKNCSIISNA